MDSLRLESFGYDLHFSKQQADSLVILSNDTGKAQVFVSPKYLAKVFTSTVYGRAGQSFGWVICKAFSGQPETHMNAYGVKTESGSGLKEESFRCSSNAN